MKKFKLKIIIVLMIFSLFSSIIFMKFKNKTLLVNDICKSSLEDMKILDNNNYKIRKYENNKIIFYLPMGFNIFSNDESIFKLRYKQDFIELNTFSKEINLIDYIKKNNEFYSDYYETFKTFDNKNIIFFASNVYGDKTQFSMYSNGIEIKGFTSKYMLYTLLLKSFEIIKDAIVFDINNNSIDLDNKKNTDTDENNKIKNDENSIDGENGDNILKIT